MQFQKNDLITLNITDMGNDGEGIGKSDGFPFFVQNAVTGDEIEAVVTKVKKGYAYAHLKKIVKPSPDRVEPACPQARSCGGCTLQSLSYEAQLRYKENKVKNNLVRIGHFDEAFINEIMEPIIGMEDVEFVNNSKEKQGISKKTAEDETVTDSSVKSGVFRYRNKSQFPVGLSPTNKDEPVCGYYAAHSHRIVPVEDCIIGNEENQDIVRIVMDWMKAYHIRPYDETTGTGIVRHILIRKGFHTGEILICLVLAKDLSKDERIRIHNNAYPDSKWSALTDRLHVIPGIVSVCVNINPERTNVILGAETVCLWGKPAIEDKLCGLTFSISAQSFYQINPVQAERLYYTAVDYAGLTGNETVWDLYCGIGTISLAMAKSLQDISAANRKPCGQVYGVEIVPQAIEDAKENAKRNKIENVHFVCGKAEDFTDLSQPDVIVADPPRKGLAAETIDIILQKKPNKMVYVSCDPATLARDLRLLADGGYMLQKVRPVDMFPHTTHIETVCKLEKS